MSIVWADFPSGQYGIYGTDTANMLDGVWAQVEEGASGGTVNLIDDPDPNIGSAGQVLSVYGGTGQPSYTRIVNPAGANATAGIGVRLWQTQLPSGNGNNGNATIWFQTAANASVCYIKVFTNGSIGAYNSSGTLLGTSSICLTANSYKHIEIKVLRHASAGTIEVRVDGVVKLALTGLALGATDIGQYWIGSWVRTSLESTPSNRYKDFVLWDGVGSVGNDFQGSVAVRDLYTDADIDLNWTPSTGSTGWDLLDKTTPADSTYISAADPPPDPAKFSLTDLPPEVTTIKALLPIMRAQKTDGGDCNVQVGLTPNNVDWTAGTDVPLTTSFTYTWDVSEVSPDTGVAWTPTEVNDAYIRFDRTL